MYTGVGGAPLRSLPIAESLVKLDRMSSIAQLVGVASLLALLAADVLLCGNTWAQTASRIPVNTLPVLSATPPKTDYGAIKYKVDGNVGTVTQTAPTNIVSWKSFDIGSAASVNIVQPSSTAVLLNKVDGGAYLNKTTIDGMLNANGRVYIYNPNGILFGKTATVNVNTLMASSLRFDEARVIGGLLLPGSTPVLGADPAYAGGVPGAVQVEGDASGRAALTASNGGSILLAAPTVVNNGILNAPDGQVILAAGGKVYLAAPQVSQTGTNLRGLLVEVSNDYPAGSVAHTASVGASMAENGESGQILVGQGNATMIGYAVNQKGVVSATTSVNLNGSIYLYARDQAQRPDANGSWQATRTGNLALGQNSVTEVLPSLSDASTISATTAFNKSIVKLNGANIELQQNASIVAPGGNVTIKAERLANNDGVVNPDGSPNILDPTTDTAPRVDFAPGSLIDVSGSSGTLLPMEKNVITVDLRGAELADNVVLRDSPLYATKVNVDIRKGTSAANIDGWLKLVEHNLGEVNAAGGTISVSADGAIIQRAGSTVNVDGGWIDYQPGYVNTTQLQFGEKLVDIGSAAPNTLYTAAVNLPNSPNNFEFGYRQGSSAGTVQFSAPILVQQGDLSGAIQVGSLQRSVTAAGHPKGGQLQIGNVNSALIDPNTGKANIKTQVDPNNTVNQFVYTGDLQIGGATTRTEAPPDVGAAFEPDNALVKGLDIDTAVLALAGFSRITALTSGNIKVTAPVTLAPGGQLWLGAGQSLVANASGTLSTGGDIQFSAPVTIPGGSLTAAASGTLQVADGVHFALAGLWTNDQARASPVLDGNGYPVTPLVLKGGVLNLSVSNLPASNPSGSKLLVGDNVSADVSAGAWLDVRAKTTQGSAGSISLQAIPLEPLTPSGAVLQLGSGLSLSGYGFSSGGTLKLADRNVSIGTTALYANNDDLWLQPAFFQQGGFTSYDITGNINFDVLDNTVVNPRALSWQLNQGFNMTPSGEMVAVAAPYLFGLSGPARTRPATSVTFRAPSQVLDSAGMLKVGEGARLVMDPGANLNLYAGRQLTELGTLNAPAGRITLGLTGSSTVPFDPKRSIWFGSQAEILATGSRQRLYTDGDGVSSGEMLDGGTIQVGGTGMVNGVLSAVDGYVVAEKGSVFDVSGTWALGLRFKSYGAITPTQDVASSGGSIEIRASEGLLFDGILKGAAGGRGASGGSLTVALDTQGQSHTGSPGNQRILTILPGGSGSIVPSDLQPDQPIVADVKKYPDTPKEQDLGWLLSGSSTGANAKYAGQGWISNGSFASGGFGRLGFKSQDVLAFGLGKSDLTLSARDALILDAPTLRAFTNSTNNAIEDTSTLSTGHTLTLSASYIQMGSADQRYQLPGASSTGNAQMNANGTTIDLIGNSAMQGFGSANLNAGTDIRLTGFGTLDADGISTGYTQGSLTMTGNLTLTDAQTYPTTLSDYTFMVSGNGADAASGTLTFAANGNAPQQVLSAGGSLTAIAPHIIQAGQVVAPFGSITLGNLDATPLSGTRSNSDTHIPSPNNPIFFGSIWLDNLNFPNNPDNAPVSQPIITADLEYKTGSVTSVAGSGVVPFGSVSNGSVPVASTWQYNGVSFVVQNPINNASLTERTLPGKAIISHAQAITAGSGSVQDLSGGGSLLAYEFTPGKGGSKDVLDSNTTFAINPDFHGSVAPIDSHYGGNGLKSGDSVYLSGMTGLPAGTYTLLPAHYALLPGSFSVTVAANTRDMQPGSNLALPDGSMLVAGHLTGSGSTRSNGFIVSSGAVVSNKSEFTISDATAYFTGKAVAAGVAAPELPVDGGHLAFDATGATSSALVINSTINLGAASGAVIKTSANNTKWTGAIGLDAASGGRAGIADISAPQIEVVAELNQETGDAIKLIASDLVKLGADSLLLGGLRGLTSSPSGGGSEWGSNGSMHLKVGASNVTLGNDTQLNGTEIVIVASDSINLDPGASLQSRGTMGRSPQGLILDGGGALLRASSGGQVSISRTNPSTETGTLNIESGATVEAGGSANLDATGGVTLDGQLNMALGSALSLGSPGISLGSDIPAADTNLQFGADALATFSGLSDLAFNSYASTIDLYGAVNLGSTAMHSLSFKGTGFQGYDGTADAMATIAADTVRFAGAAANAGDSAGNTLSGLLTVQANTLEIGNNAFAIHGYADSTLTARGEAIATGASGQLVVDQNLTLAAGRINTASGAAASISSGGNLILSQADNPLTLGTAPGMGGQLNFGAARIVSDAQIEAPSGKVVMSATDGIDITGGQVTTAGKGVVFGSTTAYAPGGTIALAGGSVTVGDKAVLDVSATGAAAGVLSISATKADGSGSMQLGGTLKGGAVAGIDGVDPTQGQFALDTDRGDRFGALNAQLNAAGFTESRQFRFRSSDVTLADNDNVTAHQVVIAADNGNITIGGNAVIDASSAKGGSIELYASQTVANGNAGMVTLRDNAQLLANATAVASSDADSTGNGGSVVIGTGSADGLAASDVGGGSSINLSGGSIDVGGGSAARNGTVTLRAPRVGTGGGNDVAVASLNTDIQNSSATVIEAYSVYQGSAITEHADSATNLDATSAGRMYGEADNFSYHQTDILDRLGYAGENLSVRPGIEVRAPSDLTVSVNEFAPKAADRGWNLEAWRFGGEPVTLTLRAAGNLNIIGSISDGFVKPANPALAMPDWQLDSGISASYRLVGGANLASANPLAVNADSGDVNFGFADRPPMPYVVMVDILDPKTGDVLETTPVTVPWRSTDGLLTSSNVLSEALNAPVTNSDAPVALIRSGTGSINVAAGRDVTLGMAKFFVNTSSDLHIDSTVFSDLHLNSKVLINGTVFSNPHISGAAFSEPLLDGTPRVYDAAYADGSYKVALYGASVYTAGQATNLAPGFTAPQNVQNSHYGASPATKSSPAAMTGAAFGSGGGAITIDAGRNVSGPQNLDNSWSYQNADYQAAVPFDPDYPDYPAEPAMPSTTASLPTTVPLMVNDWLFRQGRSYVDANGNAMFEKLGNGTTLNTAWWSRYDYFNQGIATFGGGDVRVTAAGDVADLSASVATNAYMPGTAPTSLKEQGGGDLAVRAGGDISGGAFYVQKGEATLRADGSVTAGNYVSAGSSSTAAMNPVLALGDAAISVTAGRSIAIETAYNPMLTEQSINNVDSARKPGLPALSPVSDGRAGGPEWDVTNMAPAAVKYRQTYAQFSNFSTYGENSAVSLTAVGGNLLLNNDAKTLAVAGGNNIPNYFKNLPGAASFQNLYVLEPARYSAAALSGDLSSSNGFTLMPSKLGQLDLLAAGTVNLGNGAPGTGTKPDIIMLDNDPNAMTNSSAPRIFTLTDINVLNGSATGIAAHMLGGLHTEDTQPVRLVALTGDMVGDSSKATTVSLPKFAEILAGRDIRDLGFSIQQNSVSDVSTVAAGRDFIETTSTQTLQYDDSSQMKNIVTGPGRIDISAGRNVDFGNRGGLVTRGNLDNPYLSEGGADINIVAGGAQPDYASVVSWLNQYGSVYVVSSSPQDMLDLRTFVGNALPATASAENVWAAFRTLPQDDQTLFLDAHPAAAENLAASATRLGAALAANDKQQMNVSFFSSLVEASKQSSMDNFDQLIASLFPAAAQGGNIAVFASQVKTEQGGAINLFAPTGSVYAGLTTGTNGKSASTQGLFTIRGGAIAALVKDDFLVNQGRVFTLGGGDITLVTQYNNIDAGRGSKTAVSAPPPLITIDPNGMVVVDVSGSISGSGIATLKTHPDQPASNVYAVAPRGIFDAGDAGVRSSGSVEINAHVVLNAANISATGTIAGAPTTVAAPSLGNVAAPSSATSSSGDATRNLGNANTAGGASAALNVEVVGYGDENTAPNTDHPGQFPDGACSDGARNGETCNDNRKKNI